jgi:hypothetical protein
METQNEMFEREDEDLTPEPSPDRKKYFEEKISAEKFRKMKMENDLKAGTLVYKTEAEDAWRQCCEILQSFFKSFTEVVPFEASGKDIEESRHIHVAAVEDCRHKLVKALETYIKEKETANA